MSHTSEPLENYFPKEKEFFVFWSEEPDQLGLFLGEWELKKNHRCLWEFAKGLAVGEYDEVGGVFVFRLAPNANQKANK